MTTAHSAAADPTEATWEQWRTTRSIEARNGLWLLYQPLVDSVARRLSKATGVGGETDAAELASFGQDGLLRALERYEPEKGPFGPFAARLIEGAARDGKRRSEAQVAPRSVRAKVRLTRRAAALLEGQLGRSPTYAEIAAELGIALSTLLRWLAAESMTRGGTTQKKDLQRTGRRRLRTDQPERPWTERFIAHDPASEVVVAQWGHRLAAELSALPMRSQTLLWMRYVQHRTLGEIGEACGLSASGISTITSAALKQVVKSLEAS